MSVISKESEKDIKVEVKTENNEVVIRTGPAAANPKERVPVGFKGTIAAVVDYYRVRKPDIGEEILKKTMVTYSKEEGVLRLHINEDSHLKDLIEGKIEEMDEYKTFKINVDGAYRSPAELAKFIRSKRHLFNTDQGYIDLFSKLNNFSATINTVMEKKGDDRGNELRKFERTMQTLLPEAFVLTAQLVKGEPETSFSVEIGIEPTVDGAKIWLLSNDLVVKLKAIKDGIIDKALESFTDHPRLEY